MQLTLVALQCPLSNGIIYQHEKWREIECSYGVYICHFFLLFPSTPRQCTMYNSKSSTPSRVFHGSSIGPRTGKLCPRVGGNGWDIKYESTGLWGDDFFFDSSHFHGTSRFHCKIYLSAQRRFHIKIWLTIWKFLVYLRKILIFFSKI